MREIRCVRRRARKRWPLVLLITLLLTTAVALRTLRQQRLFESTVVMRVVEKSLDLDTAPPAARRLRQHIMQVALSRQALQAVADEFGLYKKQRNKDPSLVDEGMREAINLDVFDDDFDPVAGDSFTRTTRIAITFAASDPELALAVVRRLGALVEKSQLDERQAWSTSLARETDDGVELLRQEAAKLRRQQAESLIKQQALESPAAAELAKRHLQSSIERTESQLSDYAARAERMRLRSDFEMQEGGLRFELVDPGQVSRVALTDRQRAAIFTSCAFLFLLPLVSLAVGTFDSRARDSDGLRRIGVLPLGEVRSFEGMDCGAWIRRKTTLRGGI